jgi:hypothetical protein
MEKGTERLREKWENDHIHFEEEGRVPVAVVCERSWGAMGLGHHTDE